MAKYIKGQLSNTKDVLTIPQVHKEILELQKAVRELSLIGGVPEAPTDGRQYGRQLTTWTQIPAQNIQFPSDSILNPEPNMVKVGADLLHYIQDAPASITSLYGRVRGGWGRIPTGVGEAPVDGETYGRKNAQWAPVSGLTITNYTADAASNLQSAVELGWNDYAGRLAITRTANEVILFQWTGQSGTSDDIYQYTGTGLGPTWNTTSSQWVAVAGGAVSWGDITGDINAQTDLAKGLDAKGSVGLDYSFDGATYDPTALPNGTLRLNNADQNLATEMYASKFSGLGNPLVDFLGGFQEQDYLNFIEKAGERDFSTYQITGLPIDNGDYFTIPIINNDFTGPVNNGVPCQLYWTPAPKSTVRRGGTAGQVYAKKTNDAFDGEWVDPDSGPQGEAATVDVGSTTTLGAGVPATVVNVGTVNDAIFDFGIPKGAQGVQGPAGNNGKTVLNGLVDPTTEGTNGDFYINTTTDTIFGPRIASNDWGAGTPLVGPTGPQGTQGIQGEKGDIGATGAEGPEGPQGIPGPQGIDGPQGGDGSDGAAATVSVSPTVIKVAPGGTPTVTNEGTSSAAIFQFGVVTGDVGNTGAAGQDGAKGDKGDDGAQGIQGIPGVAATADAGATTTLPAGSSALVTNVGTTSAAIFDFNIPQGVQGVQGIQGEQGEAGLGINVLGIDTIANIIVKVAAAIGDAWVSSDAGFDDFGVPVVADDVIRATSADDLGWSNIGPIQGPQGVKGDTGDTGAAGADGTNGTDGLDGAAATIAVGTVTPVTSGTPPTVTNVGTSAAAIFDFELEAGVQGVQGIQGTQGIDGPAGAKGDVGSQWITGAADPTTEGVDNDMYLNTTSDDYFKKLVGVWSLQGNLEGAQGVQGIQGPIGVTGDEGPQGVPGNDGADGVDGGVGPQGPQGDPGLDGDDGAPGATGSAATVDVDPIVISIPAGGSPTVTNEGTTAAAIFKFGVVVGNTGAQGTQGIQGIDGPTGPAGPQGDDGPQGIQGIAGLDGTDGSDGAAGADGAVWFLGEVDPTTEGVDGDLFLNTLTNDYFEKVAGAWVLVGNLKGDTGATGQDGATGAQGIQGDEGPQGPQGDVGAKGDQGIQGLTGAQGPIGLTGADGADGADSTVPGPEGPQGPTGADSTVPGPQGDTGPQGVTGDTGAAATLDVGATTTLGEGVPATVTAVGTTAAQIFDFGIPVGVTGATGPAGAKGDQGDPGLGTNPLGQDTTANIVAKTALAEGDAYITTDGGLDSEGSTVTTGDLLRATNTLAPSNWVTLGPIQGPQGVQGEQGIQGEDGVQGIPGNDGTDGATGPAGAAGTDGNTVLNGIVPPTTEGVDGDFFIDTATDMIYGPKGATTPGVWDGGTSLVGPQGAKGDTGEQGTQGGIGPEGPQGPAGNTGAAATVTAGIATVVAPGGVPTVQNSGTTSAAVFDFGVVTGNTGATGATGDTGPAGADGVDGAPGAEGPTGPQGTPGVDGIDGAQGPVGPAGPSAISTTEGTNLAYLGTDLLIQVDPIDLSGYVPYTGATASVNIGSNDFISTANVQGKTLIGGDGTSIPAFLRSSSGSRGIEMRQTDNTKVGEIAWNPSDFIIRDAADAQLLSMNFSTKKAYFSSDVTATDFVLSSDRRLKEDIKDEVPSTEDVRIVQYKLKGSDKVQVGVIADELEETNPEFVVKGETPEDMDAVSYTSLMMAMIKELRAEVKELKEQLKTR